MEISEYERRLDVADIPYDVLGEIFEYCLPDNPLKLEKPNTLQAPMVLCQICSAWREVALSTPRLWIYLCYTIGTHDPPPGAIVSVKDVEFLRWWLRRIRTLQPFVRLASTRRFRFFRDTSPNSKALLLRLITSARYLNLDVCWTMALIELEKYESIAYANLNTLVLTNSGQWDRWGGVHYVYNRNQIPDEVRRAFPICSNSMNIRRLIMDPRCIAMSDVVKPSIVWSNITHFYASLATTLPVWFSLIRKCVSLVSGHILLDNMYSHGPDFPLPANKTLPQLRELVIGGPKVASMLQNLFLPSLLSLRIDNRKLSVDQINEMVSSTPALEHLELSPNEIFLREGAFIPGDTSPNSLPLRNIVPELKYIHFGGHVQNNHDIYAHPGIVTQAFLGPWLDLGADSNTITRLEFSSDNRLNYRPLQVLIGAMQAIVPSSVELTVRSWNATSILLWGRWTVDKLQFADIDPDHRLFGEVLE